MVETKTPAATTSRIIPPIMNEIFALQFAASREQTVWHEWAKAAIARRTQPRKRRRRARRPCEVIERALDGLARRFSRQRKTSDPDLFRLRKLCHRRLMPAVGRRQLDLAAIGAADSWSSATPTAQSMYSSSSSVMVWLLRLHVARQHHDAGISRRAGATTAAVRRCSRAAVSADQSAAPSDHVAPSPR
jgi:hypothetical protein